MRGLPEIMLHQTWLRIDFRNEPEVIDLDLSIMKKLTTLPNYSKALILESKNYFYPV